MTTQGNRHAHYELERSELNVHFTGTGSIVLVDGGATVYGAPLKKNVRYNFSQCGVPVVCTLVCRVHVEGNFTAVVDLLSSVVDDIHAILDLARTNAELKCNTEPNHREKGPRGPRVLVVGNRNTGKSTLCRALINLATSNRKYGVALVDTDVGRQHLACPGTVATVFVEDCIPVDDGYNTMMPLTFFLGDNKVTLASRKHYLDLCATTAQAIASVCLSKPKYALGGVIVKTMDSAAGVSKNILLELLSVFSITHVVFCGFDYDLADEFRKGAIGHNLTFLSYPRQPRMYQHGLLHPEDSSEEQLLCYFRGTLRTPLSPYRGVASVRDVQFVHALTMEVLSWEEVKPLSLAGVSWADTVENVHEANIAGFIVLLEIGKKFFSFLSPAAGSLPRPFLLVSPTIKLPWCMVPPFSSF